MAKRLLYLLTFLLMAHSVWGYTKCGGNGPTISCVSSQMYADGLCCGSNLGTAICSWFSISDPKPLSIAEEPTGRVILQVREALVRPESRAVLQTHCQGAGGMYVHYSCPTDRNAFSVLDCQTKVDTIPCAGMPVLTTTASQALSYSANSLKLVENLALGIYGMMVAGYTDPPEILSQSYSFVTQKGKVDLNLMLAQSTSKWDKVSKYAIGFSTFSTLFSNVITLANAGLQQVYRTKQLRKFINYWASLPRGCLSYGTDTEVKFWARKSSGVSIGLEVDASGDFYAVFSVPRASEINATFSCYNTNQPDEYNDVMTLYSERAVGSTRFKLGKVSQKCSLFISYTVRGGEYQTSSCCSKEWDSDECKAELGKYINGETVVFWTGNGDSQSSQCISNQLLDVSEVVKQGFQMSVLAM